MSSQVIVVIRELSAVTGVLLSTVLPHTSVAFSFTLYKDTSSHKYRFLLFPVPEHPGDILFWIFHFGMSLGVVQ